MPVNFEIIGLQVRKARIHHRMSQAVLAERIDMSATYISHIETAKKRASLEVLVRIANVLGVTVDYLLSGNQVHDSAEYRTDLMWLIEVCTGYEKRIIYDIASATKKILLKNKYGV